MREQPVSLFKTIVSNTIDKSDLETLNLIKSDIKLIQDQVTGNYEQIDLSNIPRIVLKQKIKTYS
jgi:hypothetical protein